jgi:hypothetical protein
VRRDTITISAAETLLSTAKLGCNAAGEVLAATRDAFQEVER